MFATHYLLPTLCVFRGEEWAKEWLLTLRVADKKKCDSCFQASRSRRRKCAFLTFHVLGLLLSDAALVELGNFGMRNWAAQYELA